MSKYFIALLLFQCLSFQLPAQSIESLLQEGHELENQANEAGALKKYSAVLKVDSSNATALNQSAILTVREGRRQKTTKAAEPYFLVGKNYADKATRLYPGNKVSLLALSMALQELSLHAGAKEKAAYIKEIKSNLDKALSIDSSYARAWHMLGNWNIEVSQMNFAEKAATKLLFGGLPDASTNAAIRAYLRCRRLDPSYILNYYDLANAYHTAGDDTKAIAVLKQALRLRPILQDDHSIQARCKDLLESLQ